MKLATKIQKKLAARIIGLTLMPQVDPVVKAKQFYKLRLYKDIFSGK